MGISTRKTSAVLNLPSESYFRVLQDATDLSRCAQKAIRGYRRAVRHVDEWSGVWGSLLFKWGAAPLGLFPPLPAGLEER